MTSRQNTLNPQFALILGLIFIAAISRLLPHPPNFTPIGAMALFGAAYFQHRWMALLIPALAIWFSSVLLDNIVYSAYYDGFVWFSNGGVYIAFALITLLGMGLLKHVTAPRLLMGSLGASILFFLVSNFFVWTSGLLYPMTASGLMACFAAGLPFFRNAVLGDLFYVAVLFGTYAWVTRSYPTLFARA